jgi:hypothetical protein
MKNLFDVAGKVALVTGVVIPVDGGIVGAAGTH